MAVRVIEIHENVFHTNESEAEELRYRLRSKGVFMLNIMSSPGSGKTTLLRALIPMLKKLRPGIRIGVMDVDIETCLDIERLREMDIKTLQIHNGGLCHIDADMTRRAVEEFGIDDVDILLLENIGNLVCPAEFDTGAHKNMMILSVPEGDDKPLKYPLMFSVCDLVVFGKTDTKDFFDFDEEKAKEHIDKLNRNAEYISLSAKTGEGIKEFADWVLGEYDKTIKE